MKIGTKVLIARRSRHTDGRLTPWKHDGRGILQEILPDGRMRVEGLTSHDGYEVPFHEVFPANAECIRVFQERKRT